MALFLIKRDVRGASETDYDAAVFRAVSCSYEFEGLHWVQSYWDRDAGFSYCIYEAASEEQVRQHSVKSQIACDEVCPVTQIAPDEYTAGRRTEAEASAP